MRDLQWDSFALILAGGNGTRLGELTRWQCKPARPFGGHSRPRTAPHLQAGWSFLPRSMSEFIEMWPAQQRIHFDGSPAMDLYDEHWPVLTAPTCCPQAHIGAGCKLRSVTVDSNVEIPAGSVVGGPTVAPRIALLTGDASLPKDLRSVA